MTTKLGKDIVQGDAIDFLGKLHTITGFSDRKPFIGAYVARVAYSASKGESHPWAITLFDSELYEIA